MTFLAPGFLYASLAIAAAIVALHFIVTRQPRSSMLPTARFVPDTRTTTIDRARRPSDLLVMFLRVLTVLAAGAALAKPILTPSRRAHGRVLLVDVSRSARDSLAMRDSARAIYRNGDALVLFDSVARVVTGNVGDSLNALRPTDRRGNLSAALISSLRAASGLRDRADSLELVIVSPFAREELDAATDSVRKLWPGRARLVTIATPSGPSETRGGLRINADDDDPLTVTVAMAQGAVTANGFIDRAPPQTSSQPTNESGGTTINWPASVRPPGSVQRTIVDAVGGVVAADSRVVAPFERRWSYPADSLRGAEVIARWVDGEPAAIEKPDGTGCTRSVAIPVSPVGDLPIRKDFIRLVTTLIRPCAQVTSLVAADPGDIARLAGSGGFAPREAFQPRTDAHSSIAPWLLALAVLAAIGELLVRRRTRDTEAVDTATPAREARAA